MLAAPSACQPVFHFRLGFFWHKPIFFSDVQHQRLCDLARLAQKVLDANAVVADIAICICPCCKQISQLAAKAEPDGADFAIGPVHLPPMGDGRLQVINTLLNVEALVKLKRLLPFRFGLGR